MNSFGNFIRKARLFEGMSQVKLAEKSDLISQTNISAWERGIQFPVNHKLEEIARVYNLPIEKVKEEYFLAKEREGMEIVGKTTEFEKKVFEIKDKKISIEDIEMIIEIIKYLERPITIEFLLNFLYERLQSDNKETRSD